MTDDGSSHSPRDALKRYPRPEETTRLPDVVGSFMELKREEKLEDYRRNISVAWWTKVAAVAAIMGAVAAVVAAVLAFLAWRYPAIR